MSKNYELKRMKSIGRGRLAAYSFREYVRNFVRSATEATDPQVFYFSMNGMVMPLSYKA